MMRFFAASLQNVRFFAWLVVAVAVIQLWGNLNLSGYRDTFGYLGPVLLTLRYLVSIVLRLAAITAGVGLLRLREWARRLVLALAGFNLLTIYWKHPIPVIWAAARRFVEQLAGACTADPRCGPENLPLVLNYFSGKIFFTALFCVYLGELLFSGSLLYYFSRPAVRKLFNAAKT